MDNNLNKNNNQFEFDVTNKIDITNNKSKNSFILTDKKNNNLFFMTDNVLKLIPFTKLIKSDLKYPLIHIKKINYKEKYKSIKENIKKAKLELIKERLLGIELKKELNSINQYEIIFDRLYQENKIILDENEKIKREIIKSKYINIKQNQLINSLRKEYNELKKICFNKKKMI
jgi:hypothetical protein